MLVDVEALLTANNALKSTAATEADPLPARTVSPVAVDDDGPVADDDAPDADDADADGDKAAAAQQQLVESNFPKSGFQAIVMNPPWNPESAKGERLPGHVLPEDLERLNLSTAVLSAGFVFVWVEKHVLARVLAVLERMGFGYGVCTGPWGRMAARMPLICGFRGVR